MQTPASRRAHEGLAHKQSFGHGDVAFSLSSFLLDCCCLCCCCIGSLRRRRSTGDPKPITASSCYDEWFLPPTKKTRNNNTIISTRLLFSPICAPVLLSYTQFHWKKNPNLFFVLFCFFLFCFVTWKSNRSDFQPESHRSYGYRLNNNKNPKFNKQNCLYIVVLLPSILFF